MESANIVLILNKNTLEYNLTTLYSIIVNKNNESVYDIYLLVDNEINIQKEITFFKSIKQNVNINLMQFVDKYPLLKLKKYLPTSVNKIIFLNYNTIVLKDLTQLFNINLKNKCLGGVIDFNIGILKNDRDFDYRSNTYINSSVLLINLEKFKNIDDENDYHFNEQTLINKMYTNDIYFLNYRYGLINDKDLNTNLELSNKNKILENVLDGINNTNIIIFKRYPWQNEYVLYRDIWIKYYIQYLYLFHNSK